MNPSNGTLIDLIMIRLFTIYIQIIHKIPLYYNQDMESSEKGC